MAVIRVDDTGAGIAPSVLSRLFEPFVQGDQALARTLGGLGLGLAIVKRLVEMHDGSVSARSHGAGKGAQFTIRLPLAQSSEVRTSTLSPPAATSPVRRVLIVEDNLDAAVSLKEALELHGHEVEIASSGQEGIEKARSFRPDVVLCDIGLPGMDGYEVARRIRSDRELRSLPLIAVSGYALPEDIDRSKAAGFDRHVAKPFDLRILERQLSGESTQRTGHS
jgi:CheY-like chemotaxis protein